MAVNLRAEQAFPSERALYAMPIPGDRNYFHTLSQGVVPEGRSLPKLNVLPLIQIEDAAAVLFPRGNSLEHPIAGPRLTVKLRLM